MAFSFSALFRRHPFGSALGLAIAKIGRRAGDRHCSSSYAQFGEDRQILPYLGNSPTQFYVDIGCNSPDIYSNTYLLYQLGWSGLCVDANQALVKQFHRLRPKDKVECACVGGEPGEVTFVIAKEPLLSHVAGAASVHPDAGRELQRVKLPVKTLEQLFEEHAVPRQFGLLSIDVEGVDFAALRSFDIRKWRPYMILIEIHDLQLDDCGGNEIVVYLRNAGYRLAGYSNFSALFIAGEYSERDLVGLRHGSRDQSIP